MLQHEYGSNPHRGINFPETANNNVERFLSMLRFDLTEKVNDLGVLQISK